MWISNSSLVFSLSSMLRGHELDSGFVWGLMWKQLKVALKSKGLFSSSPSFSFQFSVVTAAQRQRTSGLFTNSCLLFNKNINNLNVPASTAYEFLVMNPVRMVNNMMTLVIGCSSQSWQALLFNPYSTLRATLVSAWLMRRAKTPLYCWTAISCDCLLNKK